eukprot:CAMPEP_0197074838 /NCGR_PEP_ID=MMETSP1384-20130603/211307_1 /TAXON_ID=29189 /ORGANISM="Ammonia sp." /LENGTH=601 /DNA_ID=CAMNT_0042513679 /DNA_START=60 /DNA_END=1863 /DNA_ORIENTATION=-
MKFGKYLQENQIEKWATYYVHYKSLKKFIAMVELNVDQGISNHDEQYFFAKIEENVKRIEEWFLKVRNKCFERFESVQNDLPKEIKSKIPGTSGFISFQYNTRKKSSKIDSDTAVDGKHRKKRKRKNKKSSKKKDKASKKERTSSSNTKSFDDAADDEDDEEINSDLEDEQTSSLKARHKVKGSKSERDTQSQTSSSTPSTMHQRKSPRRRSSASHSSEHRASNMQQRQMEEQQQKNRVHVIDMNTNDHDAVDHASTEKSSSPIVRQPLSEHRASNMQQRQMEEQQQKNRVHVIDMNTNDQQQVDEGQHHDDHHEPAEERKEEKTADAVPRSEDYENEDTPASSYGDEEEEDEDDVFGRGREQKYDIFDDQDEESWNEKYLRKDIDGELISPPSTLFIENAVFSHLPPSAHRECLSILLTLGKLKLFAWQNSEGVRKIIKKYDKRFDKKLTSTLWPKIKLNEFVQETKNDSYIAQVAAVLCTRTIPFGHLDANELREKGVNLKQMADSIQQLEQVVAEEDLKEIVPMNVEPRSYMANERTFLKWMRMSALTTLVGMILLAMRHEPVTGVLLIILSIFVLIRSYHEYYKRNEVLVNRIDYKW